LLKLEQQIQVEAEEVALPTPAAITPELLNPAVQAL
jgi:hypothetical protein